MIRRCALWIGGSVRAPPAHPSLASCNIDTNHYLCDLRSAGLAGQTFAPPSCVHLGHPLTLPSLPNSPGLHSLPHPFPLHAHALNALHSHTLSRYLRTPSARSPCAHLGTGRARWRWSAAWPAAAGSLTCGHQGSGARTHTCTQGQGRAGSAMIRESVLAHGGKEEAQKGSALQAFHRLIMPSPPRPAPNSNP